VSLSPAERRERARVAALTRHHPEDPEPRREFKASAMARYIREMVDTFPPLTEEQRNKLAVLLRGGEPDDR
jgi:hypothetical protein